MKTPTWITYGILGRRLLEGLPEAPWQLAGERGAEHG